MLSAERRDRILAAVRTRGTVRLAELAAELGASPVTLRRDVTVLADRGLVARVHGGIQLPARAPEPVVPARSAVGTLAPRALVGMVVPSVDYYYFPEIVQGAQAAVAAAGSRLVMTASAYDPAEDRRQIDRLLRRGIQALLASPVTTGGAGIDLTRRLGTLGLPVVLVERLPPPELSALALDAATTDHALGAGLAVRHLATLGHRRIGLVTCLPSPTRPAVRRGWAQALDALGLTGDVDADVPKFGEPEWTRAVDEVLDRCRDTGVDALVAHSDTEAIALVGRARERGLAVPEDLAVVAYDDQVAAASDPPLTAVRPDRHRLGTIAAELALARVAEPAGRPVHRVALWPRLVVRGSCGAPPAGAAPGAPG